MDPMDPAAQRKAKAKKIGIITGVCAFVLILGGGIALLALGYGAPMGDDAEKRGEALGMGSAMLAFWIGLIAYGLTRLKLYRQALRMKV